MPITLTCPCGKVLQANEEDAGKQAVCPSCGNMLPIPYPDETHGLPPPPPARRYTCEVCNKSFGPDEGYNDQGRVICKHCYAYAEDEPARRERSDWSSERPRRRERFDDSYRRPVIASHLAEAILVTLFCCLPFGIVAIVYAAQVNSLAAARDYEGAEAASRNAATWSWLSFGLGLGVFVIYFLMIAAGGARL
jgi:hypothetical protein